MVLTRFRVLLFLVIILPTFDTALAQITSRESPISHYKWGNNCDGWVLVDNESLSVKQEKMPPGTAEALHFHKEAQQFFFILNGEATVEIDGKPVKVGAGQGIHVKPGQRHRIMNQAKDDLEFVLSSQPSTNHDRFNINKEDK